ncbi:hypothetical protein [Anaerobacterium chartisolvens]|nr:hypothetical protein [Anaerobacterium chartisolvens]
MTKLGRCRYCSEAIIANYPEDATEEEKTALATSLCSCSWAKREVGRKREIERAKERVQQLFGTDAKKVGFEPIAKEEIHNLLNGLIELISNDIIKGGAIQIDGITKAKISVSAKGKINIERVQTTKYKLEA